MKLQIKNITFTPHWFPTLFTLFFLMVFICLGNWQIHRYHYKKYLLSEFQSRLTMKPISLTELKRYPDQRFLQLKARGYYLNNQNMLIQNRFHHDQIGYEVLTPFILNPKIQHREIPNAILINRGWVPANALAPRAIPTIPDIQSNSAMVQGYVQLTNEYQFMLGNNILNPQQRPLIMQKIDLNELSKLTHLYFYPFVLRLNQNQPNGFLRDWNPINILPQRHLGYAVQWFAMALALFIAYIAFSCKRRR